MNIGSYTLPIPLALAPMAGITDQPFRQLCRHFGAQWVTSEMLSSNPQVQSTQKTLWRNNFQGEQGVRVVQIAGSDPQQLAQAARLNVRQGAQVIDINMGCPAKKVCHVLAGSALLKNELLVARILAAVVDAVDVPVTLKTRLGWDDDHKNVETIAQLAQESGIVALAIHGRTRTQMYRGHASYELITKIKKQVCLPVWVNGDLTNPQQAVAVWRETGADGMMIGRAAQGQPWLFRDLAYFIQHGRLPDVLSVSEHASIILGHVKAMHQFYGSMMGVRIARKHIAWYVTPLPDGQKCRQSINRIDNAQQQLTQLTIFLDQQVKQLNTWPCMYRDQIKQVA